MLLLVHSLAETEALLIILVCILSLVGDLGRAKFLLRQKNGL